MTALLVLCTANQCRSPVAAALLDRQLGERRSGVAVLSAGLLDGGAPPPSEVRVAAAKVGIDLSGHRSRELNHDLIAGVDLVLCMTRRHVRELSVREPEMWPRAFTLREIVRRGEEVGARPAGSELTEWLELLHESRTKVELMGADPGDDVADPMGGAQEDFDKMVVDLLDLTRRFVDLAWPDTAA